jgi:anti-sigma factor RsiW
MNYIADMFAIQNRNDRRCDTVREGFSDYLDGAISGLEMAAIRGHLQHCGACATEFAAWRNVQAALGELGPAQPPARLQLRLRAALVEERERGSYLPWTQRVLRAAARQWNATVAPMALRVSGGLAAAVILAAGLGWVFGAPIQANDDRMAHLVAPHYMYSQVPPQPIVTHHNAPIVVEALVDTQGRVYDYNILEGPADPGVKLQVENDLLASVFQPATVFGVPVRGHVVMTYMGLSVRG